MNYLCTIILILISPLAWGQSISPAEKSLEAGKVITAAKIDAKAVNEQAGIWKNKVLVQPQNSIGWLNYFTWTDREKGISATDKALLLNQIVAESQKHIDQTPTFYLMKYLASGKRDSNSLFTAFEKETDKKWLYPYMIQSSIISQNKLSLAKFCELQNEEAPLSKALYEYHFNVLVSADVGATIYSLGMNDLIPMAVMQQVYHVREDVQLKYYPGEVSSDNNNYLVLSLGKDVLLNYSSAAYTGLLVKVKNENAFKELVTHFEKDFKLTEINNAPQFYPEERELYKNYLPSFILLYRYYLKTDLAKAAKVKSLIDKISYANHIEEQVNKAINR
jgi:hypothetical protein